MPLLESMTMERQHLHHRHHESTHKNRRLIVGGHSIEPHRYPYYCSIDKNNGVIVSGVLIAPDVVLSAGHVALDRMDNLTLKIGPYAVHQQEPFAETIPVESWLVPSNWSEFLPGYFTDDYLILKLKHKSTHQPIRINRDPRVPSNHQPVIMTGLGWLNASYLSPASIVQEVELLAVDNDECAAKKDPLRNITFADKIKESMLCTMEPPNTVRDACAWDSGSPVIVAGETPEEDVLVALGSTGVGCADPIFPGIQARVAADFGLAWIRHQVCRLSIDPPADFECSPVLLTGNDTSIPSLVVRAMPGSLVDSWTSSSLFSRHHGSMLPALLLGCFLSLFAIFFVGRDTGKGHKKRERVVLKDDQTQPAVYGSLDC